MTLNFKKADESELDKINTLIVESETASVGKERRMDAFTKKYTVKKSELLANNGYALYEDDFMVGFFMVKDKSNTHELEYFYIEHSRFGKGYGKILWAYVDEICTKGNIRKIRIVCGKNITPFYLKMGAEKICESVSEVYRGVKIDLLEYQVKQRKKISL